ncbi:MAG: 3-phosphoshikimate 1-carboxyvinyltransferase [Candidatus Latescibacteria bacterium]|nr:3-phosphoshikimate 1-carboxyvinyltransferase [Candidatus Latescibacterota bacterium]
MKAHVHYCEKLSGTLNPPSSKNYTTRYLLVAAMAQGQSVVRYPAVSQDATALRRCLEGFGAGIREERDADGGLHLHVDGFGRHPANPGVVDPGNAGAVTRLLMGVGSLLPEVKFATSYTDSLGTRPQGDLLDALEQLGVSTESDGGTLPLVLRRAGLRGGRVQVSGKVSSQYLSSLLFMAPLIGEDVEIDVVNGLVSQPLVRTTLEVMRQAGIEVAAADDLLHYKIGGGQEYQPGEYQVNGDYPSSAAILAAAAVAGGTVEIERLFVDSQGERAAVDWLQTMGLAVEHDGQRVRLQSDRRFGGGSFDGEMPTDMVLAMVGAAALADGESRFYGIGNLRYKECDRISVPVDLLRRIGVDCEERPDEIIVRGNPNGYPGGLELPSHHDHRVAQMLAIVGLRCRDGLVVLDADNVGKSYPEFFRDLQGLGAPIELVD